MSYVTMRAFERGLLMSEKKSLQERILVLERNAAVWLEPMRKWLKEASMLEEIAKSKDYPSKKSSLQKIFGSNLTLHAREARGIPHNHWFSLSAIKENQSNSDLSSNLLDLRGIEPLPQQCECCVMPLYYRPTIFLTGRVHRYTTYL